MGHVRGRNRVLQRQMHSKDFVNPKHEWCRHRAKSRTDPLEGDKADLFKRQRS
jgi:hypothetical protein